MYAPATLFKKNLQARTTKKVQLILSLKLVIIVRVTASSARARTKCSINIKTLNLWKKCVFFLGWRAFLSVLIAVIRKTDKNVYKWQMIRCFTFNHTVVSGTERREEREHLRFRSGLGDRLLHFQHSSGKRSSLNENTHTHTHTHAHTHTRTQV